MSLEINPGYLGATRQSWRQKGHRELVRALVRDNPRDSEKKLFEKFITSCREDEDYLISALEQAWSNTYHSIIKQLEQPTETVEVKAAKAAAQIRVVKEIASQVLLLNLEMPNGKRLRFCSGEECSRFGGWFTKIAKKVGKTKLVGQVLNEAEVRKLYK